MKDIKPFDELSENDKTTAIDIGVAASLLITRLPVISEAIFDSISREFAAFYNIPGNTAKYSLRAIGKTLFQTQWSCTITKDEAANIVTQFKQGDPLPGHDGEDA